MDTFLFICAVNFKVSAYLEFFLRIHNFFCLRMLFSLRYVFKKTFASFCILFWACPHSYMFVHDFFTFFTDTLPFCKLVELFSPHTHIFMRSHKRFFTALYVHLHFYCACTGFLLLFMRLYKCYDYSTSLCVFTYLHVFWMCVFFLCVIAPHLHNCLHLCTFF